MQEESVKTGHSHKSVHKQEEFARKRTLNTPFSIGGKRHHINQSQIYMAKHVICSLRKRRMLWEGRRESMTVIETGLMLVSFENRKIFDS